MPSYLSVNTKPYSVKDWPGEKAFLTALDPTVVVVGVDQTDHFNRILEAQQAAPNAKIVARFIDKIHDGCMHEKPKITADKYIVSPINQLNRIRDYGRNGRTAYWANEPNGHASDDDLQRLVNHTIEAMDLAATSDYDMSLTILNWGEGQPIIDPAGFLDPHLDLILLALNRHRDRHYYGLHTYFPYGLTKHLAALKKSCDRLKIPMPRCIITEFGFDNDGTNNLNGFKSREMSAESYGAWCVSACRMDLRPWLESGDVLGVATFIYGDDAGWEAYNVETGTHGEVSTAWRDVVLESAKVGDLNFKKRATVTSEVPIVKVDAVVTTNVTPNTPPMIVTVPPPTSNVVSIPSVQVSPDPVVIPTPALPQPVHDLWAAYAKGLRDDAQRLLERALQIETLLGLNPTVEKETT